VSRFLLCWELGERHHLLRLLPLATELRSSGHDVLFAVHDVRAGASILAKDNFRFVGTPRALVKSPGAPDQDQCYADEMIRAGMSEPVALIGLLDAWQGLFDIVRPDALILDNAPSALLAAKTQGIPRLVVGDGYTMPDTRQSLTRVDHPASAIRARSLHTIASEMRVEKALNVVIGLKSNAGSCSLAYMFDPEDCFLLTFELLDPATPRRGAAYQGAYVQTDVGYPMNWREAGPRVLINLSRPTQAEKVAGIALQAGADMIGWGINTRASITQLQLKRPEVSWTAANICLDTVLPDADLCIHEGSHDLLAACLVAGVPQIVVPHSGSQIAYSTCAARSEAVAIVPGLRLDERMPTVVESALRGNVMRTSASAVRQELRSYLYRTTSSRLLARALSLLGQARNADLTAHSLD